MTPPPCNSGSKPASFCLWVSTSCCATAMVYSPTTYWHAAQRRHHHLRRGTMAKRIGFGDYQYEVVEHWPRVAIRGAVADVCVDARGRVYVGVRNPQEDGSVSTILGGV